jgi:HEAT repeat protein
MNDLGSKQVEHIAAWQGRLNAAFESINSINPREQSFGVEELAEFCQRFDCDTPVFAVLLNDRCEQLEERSLELAETANKFVASAAMRLLLQLGSRHGYEAALLHLDSDNHHLLEGAIGLFALSTPDTELGRLHEFLRHQNPRVRNAAVWAFSTRPYQPALTDLLVMLSDLRTSVQETFGRKNLRGADARALLAAITSIQGAEAVPLLVEIASMDVSMRTYAVKALMGLDVQQVVPQVAHLLVDRSASLVSEVLRLVVKANYRAALPLIRPLLGNSDGGVRFQALRVLLDWEDAESVEPIFLLSQQEPSPVVRCLAVDCLAKLATNKTEDRLTSLLGDLNVQVRLAAVRALASMTSLSLDSHLVLEHLARHDDSESVRAAAQKACFQRSDFQPLVLDQAGDTPSVLLVPPQLLEASPEMLGYLRIWRESLPLLAGNCSIQKISELDHSLGMLIHALEEAD